MPIPYDPSAIITEARNDNWPATVEEFISSDPYVAPYDNLPVEDEAQRSEWLYQRFIQGNVYITPTEPSGTALIPATPDAQKAVWIKTKLGATGSNDQDIYYWTGAAWEFLTRSRVYSGIYHPKAALGMAPTEATLVGSEYCYAFTGGETLIVNINGGGNQTINFNDADGAPLAGDIPMREVIRCICEVLDTVENIPTFASDMAKVGAFDLMETSGHHHLALFSRQPTGPTGTRPQIVVKSTGTANSIFGWSGAGDTTYDASENPAQVGETFISLYMRPDITDEVNLDVNSGVWVLQNDGSATGEWRDILDWLKLKLKFNRGVFPAIQASIPYMRDWGFGNAGSNLDFFHDMYGDIAGGIWQPKDILSETKTAWTNYYARFILYVKQRSTLLEKWARYVSSREWMDESPGNLYPTTWRTDTIDLTYLGRGNWELTNLTAGDMSWNSIGYLYIIRDSAPYDHEIMFYDRYTGSGTTAKFHVTRRGLGNSTATLADGTAVRWMFIPTGSFRFLLRSYSAQYPAWIAAISFPKLVHDKLGLASHDINNLGLSGGNPIYQMLPATTLDGSYGGTWGAGTGKYSNKYPADPGVTATVGVTYNDIVANPLMGDDNYIPLHTYDADNTAFRSAGSVVNKPSAGTKILFWTQGSTPTFGSLAFMGTDEVVLGNAHPNQGDLVEIVVGCKNREALLNSILRFEVMSRDLDEVALAYTVQSVPTTFFYGPYPFKGFLHTGDVIEAAIGSWSNGPLGYNGLYR